MMAGPLVGGDRGIGWVRAIVGAFVVCLVVQHLVGKLLPEVLASIIAWGAFALVMVAVWRINSRADRNELLGSARFGSRDDVRGLESGDGDLLIDRSVICIDPKGENARVTAKARATKGKVWCLDPFEVSGQPPARYNPLDRLNPASLDLAEDTMTLADALVHDPAGQGGEAHWNEERAATPPHFPLGSPAAVGRPVTAPPSRIKQRIGRQANSIMLSAKVLLSVRFSVTAEKRAIFQKYIKWLVRMPVGDNTINGV